MTKEKLTLKEPDRAIGVWGTELQLKNVDIGKARKLIGKLRGKEAQKYLKVITK